MRQTNVGQTLSVTQARPLTGLTRTGPYLDHTVKYLLPKQTRIN